jgi:hypothetical protein
VSFGDVSIRYFEDAEHDLVLPPVDSARPDDVHNALSGLGSARDGDGACAGVDEGSVLPRRLNSALHVPGAQHTAALPAAAAGLLSQVKPATDAFTPRQLLYVRARHPVHFCNVFTRYVLLLQGVGAAAVCFGINFGVAVLVFRGQPPPTLFDFPLPLAGNFGVIIAVEVLLNYIISGSLQTLDVLKGVCPPLNASALAPFWPKQGSSSQ